MNRSLIAGLLIFLSIVLLSLIPLRNESAAFHKPEELAFFRQLAMMPPPLDSSIIFPTASVCSGCHGYDINQYAMVDFLGNDVNVHDDWEATMMANSAKDPFWRAKVSHEVLLHGDFKNEIETKCTSCHAPMGHYTALYKGADHYTMDDLLVDTIGLDGVSCSSCHKISTENLGTVFSGEIPFDTNRVVYGPYEMPFLGPMAEFVGFEPVHSDHINDAGICAPCHTLITESFDINSQPTGETFVEQATYHEWLNSTYNADNVTCQSCHMPRLEEPIVISANYLFLEGRSPYGLHDLVGGNAHMLRLMKENREALGISASAEDYDETISKTLNLLQFQTLDMTLNVLDVSEDTARFELFLRNKAGHKFPSGYPSRRAVVEFIAVTESGDTLLHSGRLNSQYELETEDDPFEPHYQLINNADQVQIYETVAGNTQGNFTTSLERAYSTLKDNRLTPEGFTKSHEVYDTTQIVGYAFADPDFNVEGGQEGSGTDRIRYHVPLDAYEGFLDVTAKVYYQSLPPKWMEPILALSTPEIDTFRTMFNLSDKSPVLIAEETVEDLFVMGTSRTITALDPGLLNVYPNPTRKNIRLSVNGQFAIRKVELLDLSGRLVKRWDSPVNELTLPGSGVFVIRVTTDKGVLVRKVASR